MAKNNNEYIVKIGADIKNLKKDIKSELQGVLREVDSVGEAVANGFAPDTKEFESKLASLEAKMEKLANSSKDVEQQVSSMKTAFKGFAELEASMKVIGEQNKEMYDTFVKMTPYMQEFAKTFAAMKPEQAGVAFANVFKGVQNAAQQAADTTKKSYHEVETDVVHGAKVVNGAVETMGRSVNEAVKELEKLIGLRKTYNTEKDYKGLSNQESLRKEIELQKKSYEDLQMSLSDLTEEDSNYNRILTSTIETGQKLLALWDKLDDANPRSSDLKSKTFFGEVEEDVKYFLEEYKSAISAIPAEISKVELKPLKLKVDISDDGKLLEQINKQIDSLNSNSGLRKIEIETMFVDPVDKADVDIDDPSITSDKTYQQIEKSLQKQIKRVNTAFEKETKTLTDKITEFKKNIDESLKLKFNWTKGNNADEIQTLFDLVQELSYNNPIILHPDTDDFISKIDEALKAHEFTLKLDNSDVALNAKIVGGVPIVGGFTGRTGCGPLTPKQPSKSSQPTVQQQPSRAPDTSPASAEEKRQTKVVEDNSNAVVDNTSAINDAVSAFKSWASGINRSLGSGDQKKIGNAMAKKHAMQSVVGFDPTELNDKQLAEKVADLLQNTTIAESLKSAKSNIPELKSRGINLVTDKFLEKFVGAQDAFGTQRSTHQVEAIKHSHKEYYEFAKTIAQMGGSLKKSFVNEGIIPGAKSLEQVGELFEGTSYQNLSKSAYEYANAIQKVSEEFADGGNLYEFMQSLDTQRKAAQGVLDSNSATKKERDVATKTISDADSIKTQIIDRLSTVGEKYESDRKQVAGLIASISKGFKFTLTLKGENGKEDYKLSFNDKTAEADYHVQYYGEMLGRMNKIDWDNDVVASEFSSTINNSQLHLMYDDVMGPKEAVSSIVSQYNALDDKTKAFFNTFITDINTFLDETASTGKRWKVIEESFFSWQSKGSKQVLGINTKLNDKYKSVKDKEDSKTLVGQFLNVLEESMSVYSSKRVSAAQQRQMARGTDKGEGVFGAKKNIPASEKTYKYNASDRAYRTEYSGETKSLEEYETELAEVNGELSKSNAQLEQYKSNLEAVRLQRNVAYKKGLVKKGLSQEQRQQLKEQHPDIKSQEDFGLAYDEATKKYDNAQNKLKSLQSQIDAESKRIDDLDEQIQNNNNFITTTQSRVDNVRSAGGVEQYANQLNKQIQDIEKYTSGLAEANNRNKVELQIAEYSFQKGEIDEDTYKQQKQEIEEYIAENEKLIHSEQEKYLTLKQLRDDFLSSGVKDKDGHYLSADIYEKNQEQNIQLVASNSNKLLSERNVSMASLESLRTEVKRTANESSSIYTELYNLEIAFNEEYHKYVSQQLVTTKQQLDAAKSAQTQVKTDVANAQQNYNSVRTAIEVEDKLIATATTEADKKKHEETKEQLESKMADADVVLQEAKQKQSEIDRSVQSLSNKVSVLHKEVDKASNLRNPTITTEFDRDLQEAQTRYDTENKTIQDLNAEKSMLEGKIERLKDGRHIADSPFDKMTDSQKETAVKKEVEAINEDFKIAEDRIKEAKDRKKSIDAEVKYLSGGKNRISYGMRDRINANYALAERDLANNSDYQKFLQELNQQVGLDRETKKAKRRDWVANWIEQNDTTGKYKVTRDNYIAGLKEAQKIQEGLIVAAEQYQDELNQHKQNALNILGITEEELFAQKQITQEKEKQMQVEQQEERTNVVEHNDTTDTHASIETTTQQVESQSAQIDDVFLHELDARVRENDAEIVELRNKINSSGTTSSNVDASKFADHYAKVGANQIDTDVDKANRDFYQTLTQGAANKKGYTFADFSDVKNINAIITKAKELRAELGKMYNAGQEGSKEYITLQRQLSKLLETTRKGVSKTALADGYEKNADKTLSQKSWSKFLTDHGGADLTKFVGSKTNVGSDNKFKDALKVALTEKINDFSEEYQIAAEKAYMDAFNVTKTKLVGTKKTVGQINSAAYAAGQKAFTEFIKSGGKSFMQGAESVGNGSTELENIKAELLEEIAEIEQENKDIQAFRERYIKGMLSGTEEDNDVLIKFLSSPEEMYGIAKQAKDEAEAQIDATGKTDEQIKQETKELYKQVLFRMLTATVIGAREGINETDDDLDDEYFSDNVNNYHREGYDESSYQYGGLAWSDGATIQANTVVVNGNTIGMSGDGSAPWALEATLGKTNEILNSINAKINSIKTSSDVGDSSTTDTGGKKKDKGSEIDIDTAKAKLYQTADENVSTAFGEGTKSVRRFDERTLKLYETLTLANGETVKFTYSVNKMTGDITTSYTEIANFEKIAKQAYTELGKNKLSTEGLFGNENFNFPQDKINAYKVAVTQLNDKLKSLGSDGVTDPKDAAEVEVLTGNVKKLRTEIEGMVRASEKTTNDGMLIQKFSASELNNIQASMSKLAEQTHGSDVAIKGFDHTTNELTFTVKTGRNELTTLTYKFDELTQSVYETGRASETTTGFFKKFFSGVASKMGELARYYTGMSLLTEGFQQFKRGVQYVREIDLALTELKKVTDESDASYRNFLQTMSKSAGIVGSTVSELTNSAAAWARLGFSMKEAGELAKNTAILLNVSEFESEEQATEALISTLQAFNYEAEDSIKIVDKLNIIGNNFAISSDGIAEGLSRSASTLVAAGNTLEESIAMLAAGNKVQQDPEGLGNALKVLSMRIRGTKTELEEAGEETEGMIENTSKLRDKVMALTNVDGKGGVDILTDTGAYKSTYQILVEIANVWDKLNEYDPKAQAKYCLYVQKCA